MLSARGHAYRAAPSFFKGAFEVGKRGVKVIRHREHALGATGYALASLGLERRQARNRLARARDDHFLAIEHTLQQFGEMGLGLVNVYGLLFLGHSAILGLVIDLFQIALVVNVPAGDKNPRCGGRKNG